MPTTTGCRKFPADGLSSQANLFSRFFPSTEPEAESDWEEVEGGESAENGPLTQEGEAMNTEEVKDEKHEKAGEMEALTEKKIEEPAPVELPDVPTAEPVSEPTEEGPAAKKQKSGEEEKH